MKTIEQTLAHVTEEWLDAARALSKCEKGTWEAHTWANIAAKLHGIKVFIESEDWQ